MPRLLRPLPLLATLAALLAGDPLPAAGQSSMFGVRGLGLPGRPLTPPTRATTGSFGLFDGDSAVAMRLSGYLRRAGVLAPAIRPPTVPAGTARLRLFTAGGTTDLITIRGQADLQQFQQVGIIIHDQNT